MEVSLRKDQREIFRQMRANEGSYVRAYRKSSGATRMYWRLMTVDHSPIKNIPPGKMKPFFNLSILLEIKPGEFELKSDVELMVKKPKKQKA